MHVSRNVVYKILFALCLFFHSSALQLEAADFHVILVGDTLDSTLGPTLRKDLAKMQKEAKRIASMTKMPLHLTVLQGTAATSARVIQEISLLNAGADDVVLLYFTMHGFRSETKVDPWPDLYFTADSKGVDFSLINQLALEKFPRLFISIADCCNNVIPDEWLPEMSVYQKARRHGGADEGRVEKNYRNLFLKSSGVVIVSGCQPGLYSIAYPKLGSLYTLQFLRSLKNQVERGAGDWTLLIGDAYQATVDHTAKQKDGGQIPQHWLSVQ